MVPYVDAHTEHTFLSPFTKESCVCTSCDYSRFFCKYIWLVGSLTLSTLHVILYSHTLELYSSVLYSSVLYSSVLYSSDLYSSVVLYRQQRSGRGEEPEPTEEHV